MAVFLTSMLLGFLPFMPRPALADHGAPHVVRQTDTTGCEGVKTSPGSQNTTKELVAGTLEPGSTVTFRIAYPVDEADVSGRKTFVITDCVFINSQPVLKYEVSFVPNTTDFVLTFDLVIPADAPLGAEYCNYAKTTAAPSTSQASNRKAGPACFRIGGDLRVLKVDQAGQPLPGATFDVTCTPPGPTPPVVIEGIERTSATGITTGSDGAVSIAGPQGTSCTITETAAPPGYHLADPATVTAVIGRDGPRIVSPTPAAPPPWSSRRPPRGRTAPSGCSASRWTAPTTPSTRR